VPITQLLVPAVLKVSDLDETIAIIEKGLEDARSAQARLEPTAKKIADAHQHAAETQRKLTGGIEGMETRLKLLRQLRDLVKRGHQWPPEALAQMAAIGDFLAIPALSLVLDEPEAQQ
jgi:hypothetical protein